MLCATTGAQAYTRGAHTQAYTRVAHTQAYTRVTHTQAYTRVTRAQAYTRVTRAQAYTRVTLAQAYMHAYLPFVAISIQVEVRESLICTNISVFDSEEIEAETDFFALLDTGSNPNECMHVCVWCMFL
jgi:hypothetical protein